MARFIKIVIYVIGILTLLLSLVFFTHETDRIIGWSGSGFVHSVQVPLQDNFASTEELLSATPILISIVDSTDFIGENVPAFNDTLLTIGDSLASRRSWMHYLELPHEPGRIVPITYIHNGDTLSATFKTNPVRKEVFLSVLSLQIIKTILALAFFGLGFWVLYKRPDSAGARTLAMFCFSITPYMTFVYMPMYAEVARFQIPFQFVLQGYMRVIAGFFSSYWLLLNLYFPRKSSLLEKSTFGTYWMCFGPQIILFTLSFIFPFIGVRINLLGILLWFVILYQVIHGLYLLIYHHRNAENKIYKRQTRLVLYGSGIGLIFFTMYTMSFWGWGGLLNLVSLAPRMILFNVIFLLLLASPLSLMYALGKFRLLEIEGKLGRGTRYFIATIILMVFFVGLIYTVSELILANLGITSRTPTLIFATVLAFGFVPAQRKLQAQLENRFFPERQKLKTMVHDFFHDISAFHDQESLYSNLEYWLKSSLRINSVIPVLKAKNNGSYRLLNNEAVPLESGCEFLVCIQDRNHPLFLDEMLASSQICLNKQELEWLEHQDIALVLPLVKREELLGFLAIGHKMDDEDFHPEEVQTLKTVAEQISLTIDNLRLFEENIEKSRMEHELQIAREVQMRFLPQNLPECEGLEIAASSTFSLEVAGDYYDVIPEKNKKTCIAIGDVSGKGAGAALIMANLQASLRSLCGLGLSVAGITRRINEVIHSNTDPEQYITFFMAEFDPKKRTLTYVNAGHNPPVLLNQSGTTKNLETGGMILGFMPDAEYQEETLTLEPGDMICSYTDGLSEAMNESGDEFGDDAIEDILIANRDKPVDSIRDLLVEQVREFSSVTEFDDDLTLVLVKVR